jgi:polyphosphate kinase
VSEGMSKYGNISIVDNYLEHLEFISLEMLGKQGFISSADFMNRNLDGSRSDLSYLRSKKSKELIDNFDLGWKGNVKARIHSDKLDNKYREKT